jgi:hypothetical protein
MKGLQFQRLVLISDSKKLANQFKFPKRLNLITGKDNSIGKSTLVKNLFWALGCEPSFDTEWKSNDVKVLLEFTIDNKKHFVARYQNTIILNGKKFNSIGGEYAESFAKLVKFKVKVPNRNEEPALEIPPPAYYFLPFYIDQLKSWSTPWASFDNLGQYANWKPTLVKYHTGYISSKHFEIEEEIYEYKQTAAEADKQVQKINSAIEVLEDVSSESIIALSDDEFEAAQFEIQEELSKFVTKQAELFEMQALYQSDIYDLEKQLELATNSTEELEQDYTFAVESVSSDILECPLCGIEHDNSLASRAVLLADKSQLEAQAISLLAVISDKKEELAELNIKLIEVKGEVSIINKKYLTSEQKNENENLSNVLNVIAQQNVTNNVVNSKEKQQLKSIEASDSQKDLKKDQKKLLSKDSKVELNELFMGNLIENMRTLGAEGINLSKVKSPLDYNKLIGGGAAEGTRGLLAYQLSVLRQIDHVQNCSMAAFVVDTPNQQEQANHRYENVIDVIMANVPKSTQIILCGMENSALDDFKLEAHVINLGEKKLLRQEYYEKLQAEYTFKTAI